MQDAERFPQDVHACHALIADLSARLSDHQTQLGAKAARLGDHESLLQEQARTILALQESRAQLTQLNEELNLTIQQLLARLCGRRGERYEDPAQLKFAFDGDEAASDALASAAAEAERIIQEYTVRRTVKKAKPRQEEFPEHLPRYEVIADVAESERACSEHGPRELIGYDMTKTLEFERPKLRVRLTKYPKYVCPAHPECGVVEPSRPAGLVEGNRYDTGVAAEVITAKYAYHLPTYRQQDWFAGFGWAPQRSTLLNLLSCSAYVLEPLYDHYADFVRGSPVVPTDETKVMLLLPPEIPSPRDGDARSQRIHEVLSAARSENKTHVSARMWAYRGLEGHAANVFDFTVSRHRDGPQEFLKDYAGILLGDCYSGFESIVLARDSRLVRAACHAHARRYVYEAREHHPQEASRLLSWYRQLYDVEDRARGRSPEEVLALRRACSASVVEQMRLWLESEAAQRVLPKSPLGAAVRYLQNQWEALTVFLSDGRVPFDNNETEQLMKQIATGRGNWLFIGSVEAGYRAAILMTIVSTAHRHHLDVWLYVKDVLDRLLAGERDLASLRADQWAAAHPEAIRPYRVAEARYRADAKAARRARRRLSDP
jgi:transposase